MKRTTTIRYFGALTCVAVMGMASSQAWAQATVPPPVVKQNKPHDPGRVPNNDPVGPRIELTNKTDNRDASFVKEAAEAGLLEIAAGNIATEHASNADVKTFGQRMADDHTKAASELKSIATTKNIVLADQHTPKDQAMLNKMKELEGADFDKAYIDSQVKAHEKAVALFEKEANTGNDPELKEFAQKTLPTLKEHLATVQELRNKLSTKGTS